MNIIHEHYQPCPFVKQSIPEEHIWEDPARGTGLNSCSACNDYDKVREDIENERG